MLMFSFVSGVFLFKGICYIPAFKDVRQLALIPLTISIISVISYVFLIKQIIKNEKKKITNKQKSPEPFL